MKLRNFLLVIGILASLGFTAIEKNASPYTKLGNELNCRTAQYLLTSAEITTGDVYTKVMAAQIYESLRDAFPDPQDKFPINKAIAKDIEWKKMALRDDHESITVVSQDQLEKFGEVLIAYIMVRLSKPKATNGTDPIRSEAQRTALKTILDQLVKDRVPQLIPEDEEHIGEDLGLFTSETLIVQQELIEKLTERVNDLVSQVKVLENRPIAKKMTGETTGKGISKGMYLSILTLSLLLVIGLFLITIKVQHNKGMKILDGLIEGSGGSSIPNERVDNQWKSYFTKIKKLVDEHKIITDQHDADLDRIKDTLRKAPPSIKAPGRKSVEPSNPVEHVSKPVRYYPFSSVDKTWELDRIRDVKTGFYIISPSSEGSQTAELSINLNKEAVAYALRDIDSFIRSVCDLTADSLYTGGNSVEMKQPGKVILENNKWVLDKRPLIRIS